jgi:predicted metal-dependent peptidase
MTDPYKANAAMDYVINDHLKAQGYSLIKGALYHYKYEGMSAEEVYKLLDDLPPNPMGQDVKEGDSTPEEAQQIIDKVTQAVQHTRLQGGNVPTAIGKFIDDILDPVIPWEAQLINYASERVNDDFSWEKRNVYYSVYAPSLYSEGFGKISVYVDVSGSVSDSELNQYIAECRSIKEILNPSDMSVVCWNTQIVSEVSFAREEEFEPVIISRGGTAIGPVIDHIDKHKPELALIITDGYFTPKCMKHLGSDVLWLIVNNSGWTSPVGRIIEVSL